MPVTRPAEASASLAHVVKRWAEANPDQRAIVTEDRSRTYEELWTVSSRLAEGLIALGVRPGTRVGIMLENGPEWVAVATAVSILGARTVALSTWVERWDLERLLAASRPEVLVVSSRVRDGSVARLIAEFLAEDPSAEDRRVGLLRPVSTVVEVGPQIVPGALSLSEVMGPGKRVIEPRADPRDWGLLLFSSGSASAPKGVALVNQDMVSNAIAIGDRLGLDESDRLFVPMPMFWAMGGPNGSLVALTHGCTLVTLDRFRPGPALDILERERCTGLYTLPNLTRELLDHPNFGTDRVASLRKGVTVGSAQEIGDVIERLGAVSICNVYGCSELYANAAVTPHDASERDRRYSNGPPLPGVTIQVVDPGTGDPLPPGQVGEIYATGRVAAGYLEPDGSLRPVVDSAGFFRTGDLGQLDERGWITYRGRASEIVKTGGINVSPLEVEEFLCSHDSVDSALVFGIDDATKGEVLAAMVIPAPDTDLTELDLRAWCTGRIASYKAPAIIQFVETLPTTTTGKISRSAAKRLFGQLPA